MLIFKFRKKCSLMVLIKHLTVIKCTGNRIFFINMSTIWEIGIKIFCLKKEKNTPFIFLYWYWHFYLFLPILLRALFALLDFSSTHSGMISPTLDFENCWLRLLFLFIYLITIASILETECWWKLKCYIPGYKML